MIQLRVGEIREIKGVKIQCIQAESFSSVNTCQKCVFASKESGVERCMAGDLMCFSFKREDKKNVYFKKVKI